MDEWVHTPSTTRTRRLNELSARDVVWGPIRLSRVMNPRPWLILNNDTHPFGEEEYMTVTLTTTPHDEGPSSASRLFEGGSRRVTSTVGVASPKHAAIVRRHPKCLDESFVQTVVDDPNVLNVEPKARNDRSHDSNDVRAERTGVVPRIASVDRVCDGLTTPCAP